MRRWRRKWTVNPWALLRPFCWLEWHLWVDVVPGDAWSRYHRHCRRCLLEQYPVPGSDPVRWTRRMPRSQWA